MNVSSKTRRAYNMAISRCCGCECEGCTNADHCLVSPCRRHKNRRSQAELDAAGRYPNGRVREVTDPRQPIRVSPRPRTPEEIEAAGRYPNGRPRPDRSRWATTRVRRAPNRKAEEPIVASDPLAAKVRWFVSARRGRTTVRLPAPAGRDEAYTIAGRLFMDGWSVEVIEL